MLVLLDGALEVPSFVQLLRPRGRLVLARPPRISADFSSLFRQQLTVLPSAASPVRSGLDALIKGTLRADGLAERVLALDEVSQWWQQPILGLCGLGPIGEVGDSQHQTRWVVDLGAIQCTCQCSCSSSCKPWWAWWTRCLRDVCLKIRSLRRWMPSESDPSLVGLLALQWQLWGGWIGHHCQVNGRSGG